MKAALIVYFIALVEINFSNIYAQSSIQDLQEIIKYQETRISNQEYKLNTVINILEKNDRSNELLPESSFELNPNQEMG